MSDIIRTGLYSDKAMDIFKFLHYGMKNLWGSSQMRRNHDHSTIKRDFNNEVIIKLTNTNRYWDFDHTIWGKTSDHAAIRKWLAIRIKELSRRVCEEMVLPSECFKFSKATPDMEIPLERWTNPTNKYYRCFGDNLEISGPITVGDVNAIFAVLMSTKRPRRGKSLIDDIIGEERDPMTTEQARVIAAELVKYKAEAEEAFQKVRKEYEQKQRDAYVALCNERDAKCTEIKIAYDKRVKELKDSFAMLNLC